MDALKKFINKKKADAKFKTAGPGHRLDAAGAGSSSSSYKSPGGHHQHSQQQNQPQHQKKVPPKHSPNAGPSDEKKQAAMAALARIEKEKAKSIKTPSDLLASRQLAYIKEQARKEIEAEKQLKELQLQKDSASNSSSQQKVEEEPQYTISAGENIDPESYAVSGVFFSCPLLGPEVLPKQEIEANILRFLLEQPEDEIGMSSCLMIHSCNKGRDKIAAGVDTLCKYLDNIIQNPDETKYQKIRCSNKVFQEKVANLAGVPEFLHAAGFSKKSLVPEGGTAEEEFYVFTADAAETRNQLTELKDTLKSTTPILPELDRNIQVLMPAQVVQRRELPPEFYTLSPEELKKEQKIRAEIAERETTLRTKAQRERDEIREQRLYRYAVMRIRFPDGFTLQGTFGAWEKIGDIYEFVQDNLALENAVFSLKRSGGDSLSNLEASLAESHLPPASIVNFKIESTISSGDITYLKPEILALVQTAA